MSMLSSSPSASTFELNSEPLNPQIQCNDLKAFERRLMETIIQHKPRERLWRIVLVASLTSTAVSSYFWLQDSMKQTSGDNGETDEPATFLKSLAKHYFFTTNCLVLITLFIFGVHQRVIQTNIISNRIREVLYDFALSCDDQGKLIVKQNFSRPILTNTLSPSTSNLNASTYMAPNHQNTPLTLDTSIVTQVTCNNTNSKKPRRNFLH